MGLRQVTHKLCSFIKAMLMNSFFCAFVLPLYIATQQRPFTKKPLFLFEFQGTCTHDVQRNCNNWHCYCGIQYSHITQTYLQVFMDVVFNHTAEGNEMGPTISFRGFDNRVYYMIAPKVYTTTSRSHLQSCYLCWFLHHSGF